MNIPIYTISSKAIDLVAKIAERVGVIKGSGVYARDLRLRKVNRLRSIQSSLAIENNTLSLSQVTDIIDGKRVLGMPHEIQEVKNSFQAYEYLLEYDPYSIDDFLKAHSYMTQGLVKDSGRFRSQGVGVFEDDKLIHAGANYSFVPKLIEDLFLWAKQADVHPLLKSSIVHFEIEYIHPFMDGNGRMGRLWQSLILTKWNELFAWLPVETVVFEKQQGYYDALLIAGRKGDSEVFIEFMFDSILEALEELPINKITDILTDISTDMLTRTELEFLENISSFLVSNKEITNYKAQLLTGKSESSVRKYLLRLVELEILEAIGENKGRRYRIRGVSDK